MAGKIEQLVEDMVLRLLPAEYELVDVDYVKEGSLRYLRIYIDKSGAMSLNDCGVLSRQISKELDAKDPIPENYMLEISSPGLDRQLKKDKDFDREKGKEIELKLFKPRNGKKEFIGTLQGLNQQGAIEVDIDGNLESFEKKEIANIRLYLKI